MNESTPIKDAAYGTLNAVSNASSDTDMVWMMAALACSAIHVAAFFVVCWRTGVFNAFGRRPVAWRSLAFLTLAAALPIFFAAPWVWGPYHFSGFAPSVEAALLAVGWGYIGCELMMIIGQQVDTSEASLEREQRDRASSGEQ